MAKRTGALIEVIPETVDGDIDLAALDVSLSFGHKPSLIAITYVPTSSGARQVMRSLHHFHV